MVKLLYILSLNFVFENFAKDYFAKCLKNKWYLAIFSVFFLTQLHLSLLTIEKHNYPPNFKNALHITPDACFVVNFNKI